MNDISIEALRARQPKPSEFTGDYYVHVDTPRRSRTSGYVGKWLVFVPVAEVDDWWLKIWTAVMRGRLGFRAKAATARENPLQRSSATRVICVYTGDWRDKADVGRVLTALRKLGVTWRLSYKTDDATLSGRYGDGSAIYVSQPGTVTFDDRTGRH